MKILLGMPCMRSIPYKTVVSLLNTAERGLVEPLLIEGSLVYDARDSISTYAVKAGYDYVLFADSDMVFNCHDLEALAKHDVDICSGLYVTRNGENQNVCYSRILTRRRFPKKRRPELIPDTHKTGFSEIAACGMGFCLIKTSVLQTMNKRYKSLFEPRWGVGEDIAFCIRARRCGFKIYVDRDVKLGHVGDMVFQK